MSVKLSKSKLKGIVKECLLEILQEGVGNLPKKTKSSVEVQTRSNHGNRPSLERDFLERVPRRPPGPLVSETEIRSMTGDPILESIFKDTAQTTLVEQKNSSKFSDIPAAAGPAAMVVAENEIDDLFEGSSNWADLAFSSTKPTA